jgi:hypothetical protein
MNLWLSYLLSAVTKFVNSQVLNLILKAEQLVHVSTTTKYLISVHISILSKCSLKQKFSVQVSTEPKMTVSVQLSALPKHRPKTPISVKKSAEQIFVSFPCVYCRLQNSSLGASHALFPQFRGQTSGSDISTNSVPIVIILGALECSERHAGRPIFRSSNILNFCIPSSAEPPNCAWKILLYPSTL